MKRHGLLPASLTLSKPRRDDSVRSDSAPSTARRNDSVRPESVVSKPKIVNPLSDEFDISTRSASTKELPDVFASPPLMDGLRSSIQTILGPDARPTPIQALSLKHLVKADPASVSEHYHEYLLASETGSGKSIAYLLPMIQDLKQKELQNTDRQGDPSARRALNPRALVLAPTHELSRQLSGFAKEMIHNVKLRVLCASRANTSSRKNVSASKMAESLFDGDAESSGEIYMRSKGQAHDVDIVVGTPSKVLELMRGRGWDHDAEDRDSKDKYARRKVTVGEPQMSLTNIEWVIVDEADVLLGEYTFRRVVWLSP